MSPEDSIPLRSTLSVPADLLPVKLILLLFEVFFMALCAAAESAFEACSEAKLKKLEEEGNKNAKRVLEWLDMPEKLAFRMRAGLLLNGCGAAAIIMHLFVPPLSALFVKFDASGILAAAVVLLAAVAVLLTVGVRFPRRSGAQKPEKWLCRTYSALRLLSACLAPLCALADLLSRPLLRVAGCDPDADEDSVTEEEIRQMVDAGEETGAIEESTKDMISNIFEFDDRTVSELMTHRTDMVALADTATIEEVVRVAQEEGYSRIPVYHEDIDDVRGILYVKDLLKYVGSDTGNVTLTEIVRPAYFVPSFKKCSELFTEMTEKKLQMAIVCDEYGGTFGIISMEDLLEAIVGNIQDEYDDEEEEISRIDENRFTVDGGASIDEVSDLLGIELPEGDYDTVGGFIVDRLGRIPQDGEHPVVTYENAVFTVQQVEERRIAQLLAEIKPEQAEE